MMSDAQPTAHERDSDSIAIPTLVSDRLVLRRMSLSDASDVQRLAGDRQVAATTGLIPHPYPDGAAEQWIATHEEQFVTNRGVVWAVTLRETGELIGAIGLVIEADIDRAELGYWIGVPYWNHGYITEAASLVLRYAFEERELHRVFAHHFLTNPASGRVMEKLGMTREGLLRHHFKKWGQYVDCVYYGILCEEYERISRGAAQA